MLQWGPDIESVLNSDTICSDPGVLFDLEYCVPGLYV